MSEGAKSPVARTGAIGQASWVGTAVFAASAAGADLTTALEPAAFAIAVALFVAGCVIFVVAFLRAVERSRTDLIAVSNLFFLSGSAPAGVRKSLLGALSAQVVVALATAFARPYTSLAAGTLVPAYGLGLCGLWAARYGTFAPRPPDKPKHR